MRHPLLDGSSQRWCRRGGRRLRGIILRWGATAFENQAPLPRALLISASFFHFLSTDLSPRIERCMSRLFEMMLRRAELGWSRTT